MAEINFTCKNCGGSMSYSAGAQSLKCEYCGTINEVPQTETPEIQEELDYQTLVRDFQNQAATTEVQNAKCPGCRADVTLEPDITTAQCDYCGTQIIAQGRGNKVMLPQYLLPFKISQEESKKIFRKWIRKRRFAPNALKKLAAIAKPLKGVYYPYWTYDAQTGTDYQGQRGTYYTEQVQVRDSSGNTVTKTIQKIRWHPVSGQVSRHFDDILVPATNTLPEKLIQRMNQWDLQSLVAYAEQYLAGFKAESYTIGIEEGMTLAKEVMSKQIESDIRRDIGGDTQRITRINTNYTGITFKYILLPLWAIIYRFNKKYFPVLINARTGEIEGERPYSVIKIVLLILLILGVAAGGYLLYYFFAA